MFRNYNKMKFLLLPEYTLLTDTKTPKNDFVLIYMSNKDDIKDFIIKNNLFKPNIFLSYHYPNREGYDTIRKNLIKRQVDVYKSLRKEVPVIKRYKTNLEDYKNLNLYYDFFPLFDVFNYKLIAQTDKILSEKFMEFSNNIIEKIPYKNKILFMNLNKTILDDVEDNSRDYYFMFKKYLYFNKKVTLPYDVLVKGESSRYSLFFPKNQEIDFITVKIKMEILEKLERKDGTEFTAEEISIIKNDLADKDNSENLPKEYSKEQIKKEVMKKIGNSINRLDGQESKDVEAVVSEIVDKTDGNIEENDVLKNYLATLQQEEEARKTDILKERRLKTLDEKYKKVKINGDTLDNILAKTTNKAVIEKKDMKINHTNSSLNKSLTLSEFEKQYNAKTKSRDMVAVITAFTKDKDIKLIPTDIKVEDTSTSLDKKETMSITFQDDTGTNHNFVIDIPVMLDDRYIYLNGTKKNLNKQIIFKPIVKTGPDEVQIVTLSNKTFIYRIGTKVNIATENLVQALELAKIKHTKENLETLNKDFRTNCEFDTVSNVLTKFNSADIYFNLNIPEITEEINKKFNVSLMETLDYEKEIPFAIINGFILTTDTKDGKILNKYAVQKNKIIKEETIIKDMSLHIIDMIDNGTNNIYDKMTVKIGSNYMYSSMTSMGTKIPVVLPVMQRLGLVKLLNKLEINYTISDKRKRLSNREKMDTNVIELADCFIYYKASEHDMLLNGLDKLDLSAYTLNDLDKDTPYIFLYEEFGSKHLVKGMPGYLDILLDPISRNYIIEDMGFKNDVTSEDLLIIASEMLNQNFYRRLNDMENYRIRSNEIVYGALLYDTISTAFKKYKEAKKQGNKSVKVTVPQDTLLKKVIQITEDYSELNPFLEVEKQAMTKWNGPSGINLSKKSL